MRPTIPGFWQSVPIRYLLAFTRLSLDPQSKPVTTTTDTAADRRKLGAFIGVFTPSILTILGVIMYLRAGWVIGNAGLLPTFGIVALANAITFVTALSISAVATNMRVGLGGPYYIISRSLGLEIGGAIGLPLYLSQILSVTLYSFGFAESLRFVWPEVPVQPVAVATIIVVTLISIRGAALALKIQLPIMLAVGLSLLSLAAGASFEHKVPVFWGDYAGSDGFWDVFAVFFPAVTGIMAGVALSGDLRDPQKAIPRGTLAAVGVGFVVYLAVPVILAFNATPDALLSDSLVWTEVAVVPALVLPGLWGAIISSAMGSILGGPRTLQALAQDRIVPRFFGRRRLKTGESAVSIAVSAAIAVAAVLLGGLNAVAMLVTMFFLTTYGMANLVAGLEKLVADPSYRPSLKVPGAVSLAGAVACFWVMFVISAPGCVIAIAVELGVWGWLKRRRVRSTWGDMRRGLWMTLTRYALVQLHSLPENPRNWRPHLLLLAGDLQKRIGLLRFASWLNQERGIMTVCNLVVADRGGEENPPVLEQEEEMSAFLEERGVMAFSEVNVVDTFESGVVHLAQANGIGGVRCNTLMLGWTEDPQRMAAYFRIMRRVRQLRGLSIIICRLEARSTFEWKKRIDIWWRGRQSNGDLMLMLAYLLSLNPEWDGTSITVKSVASSETARDGIEKDLEKLIPRSRIPAESQVILKPPDQTVAQVMHEHSAEAELVFMGLLEPDPGTEVDYAKRLLEISEGFPSVVLVRNAGEFVGQLV